MASLDRIKVGQTLHDYHRYKTNAGEYKEGRWSVKVIEVDLENRKALCSWNGNTARWWNESGIAKLRVSKK